MASSNSFGSDGVNIFFTEDVCAAAEAAAHTARGVAQAAMRAGADPQYLRAYLEGFADGMISITKHFGVSPETSRFLLGGRE